MGSVDEQRVRRYAQKVAESLRARGATPRGPRPARTVRQVESYGFLGLRNRTVERRDDGGVPRFWVVGAHRERGVFIVYRPGSKTSYYGWMAGCAAVLFEDGSLGSASWKEDPLGSGWKLDDLEPLSAGGLEMLDWSDRGRWFKRRPERGEQYREELKERLVQTAHAPGVGLSRSLKRLLDGDGARHEGHLTGMRRTPAGPG